MLAGADPLSSGMGFAPPPTSTQSPPMGHPFLEAARQQEMMYRELLSRPPYSTDPVLQSQVTRAALGIDTGNKQRCRGI